MISVRHNALTESRRSSCWVGMVSDPVGSPQLLLEIDYEKFRQPLTTKTTGRDCLASSWVSRDDLLDGCV
jgi:hypothetical protein